jgi:MFS family permease
MDEKSNNPQPAIAHVPADTSGVPRLVVTGSISWLRTFAAFRHRNYRLFFCGQLVSLVGTWMHMVAMGWLVYDITRSPLKLGFIGFVGALPMTLLSLPGGALADRVPKRRILLVTQLASMLVAFALAGIVWRGDVAVWQVAVLAVLLGIANAFDVPARQSFIVELVGKDDLMNAIALNSSMFNTARVVGPALAGLLIGYVGTAGCFLLNGISFLAVIVSYLLMRLPVTAKPHDGQSLWRATGEAVRFAFGERVIRAVIALVAMMSLFGWWASVLLPVFARDILHLEARGFGLLMAANGTGALLGALGLASLGNYPHRRRLFYGGLAGFCVMTTLFAAARQPWLAGAALMGAGFCMIIFLATANTAVQLRTPDELRGRVMGLYALSFLGLLPIGQMLAGTIAESVGAPVAVWLGIAVCGLVGITVAHLTAPDKNT